MIHDLLQTKETMLMLFKLGFRPNGNKRGRVVFLSIVVVFYIYFLLSSYWGIFKEDIYYVLLF